MSNYTNLMQLRLSPELDLRRTIALVSEMFQHLTCSIIADHNYTRTGYIIVAVIWNQAFVG